MGLRLIFSDIFPDLHIDRKSLRGNILDAARMLKLYEKTEFGNLEIIFLRRSELRKLNSEHLAHDYETDILTFDISDDEKYKDAQIFISPEVVSENAGRFGSDFETELMRVVVHGLLHLSGYDDQDKTSKTVMRKKENKYLNILHNAGKSN